MQYKNKKTTKNAFTLVELLIVIAIYLAVTEIKKWRKSKKKIDTNG